MSKLKKALNVLLGNEVVAQEPTVNSENAPVPYVQPEGTMVEYDENVSIETTNNNSEIVVRDIKPTMRAMGGEEIRPGTLH